MIDKTCLLENIRTQFKDGMTVMVGGFGVPGTPFTLIDTLIGAGVSDLTPDDSALHYRTHLGSKMNAEINNANNISE